MSTNNLPSSTQIDVLLVDSQDRPVGKAEKMDAHVRGVLHRAFSVFIYNEKGELLIQRRALGKYHSAGLWANSCCGHPYIGEGNTDAALRRLREELGLEAELLPKGHVQYKLKLADGLYEHEYTHLFEGRTACDATMHPDPLEVMETAWVNPWILRTHAQLNPQNYARWFRLYLAKYFDDVFGSSAFADPSLKVA
jgi:isopentenyl-diphosphate Delta-isomerase